MSKDIFELEFADRSVELGIELRKLLICYRDNSFKDFSSVELVLDKLSSILEIVISDQIKYVEYYIILNRVMLSHFLSKGFLLNGDEKAKAEKDKELILYQELKNQILANFSPWFSEGEIDLIKNADSVEKELFLPILSKIPFPTLYFSRQVEKVSNAGNITVNTKSENNHLVLKIIAFLDGEPLVSVKRIKPKVMYTLKLIIRGANWPSKFHLLDIGFSTTCPFEQYSVSKFEISRPKIAEKEIFETSVSGELMFESSQSMDSSNLCFVLNAFFDSSSEQKELDIIGTNQLYFRVIDDSSLSLTSGYKKLDQHIIDLINQLPQTDQMKQELEDLVPALVGVSSLMGTYAQSAIFKEVTDLKESGFQKEVLRDLKIRLGEDVGEHAAQAGGFTDLKYKNVIIELKVEKQNGDRTYIAKQYCEQATQYQGVECRQVSIVLVLDLTEKKLPPGDIRNDVLLVDVPTHGTDESNKEFPSKAIIFVINGNIKNPSSYSR